MSNIFTKFLTPGWQFRGVAGVVGGAVLTTGVNALVKSGPLNLLVLVLGSIGCFALISWKWPKLGAPKDGGGSPPASGSGGNFGNIKPN